MISKRIQDIQPSQTLSLSARVKELQNNGVDVLNFTAGEPDRIVAAHVQQAAKNAIDENFSYYTATGGISELKDAIVEKFARENGIATTPAKIIVTNGAKEALYMTFQTILNPGDEVIVPTPYWVSYVEQILMADGVPVFVPSDELFHVRSEHIEQAITNKTVAVLLNSPNNPTGAIIPSEELKKIASVAEKHDVLIISDEVYEQYVYDGRKSYSIASDADMAGRTITINAISKTYAMTGWRLGYACGPKEIIDAMTKLKSHLSSGASNMTQRAAAAALAGPQEAVVEAQKEYTERRTILVEGISQLEGCSLAPPEGAFYGFINFSGLLQKKNIADSAELCEQLLEKAHVAFVPGNAFGKEYSQFARWSFAAPQEQLKEGLRRLRDYIA